MQIDPGISLVIAISLAALFAASAAHKALGFPAFIGVVRNYRIAPAAVAPALALAAFAAESAIAFGLLLPFTRSGAAAGAAIILLGYGAAIAFNIARGRAEIDCGCSFGPSADRLTPMLVVRNGILALAALLVSLPAASRVLGAVDFVFVAVAIATFSVLYLAAERLRANAVKFQLAGFGR
ncbi:MAG: MauE/DoxX family redox-associated membrane protein [Parvularculaceae bacterium]